MFSDWIGFTGVAILVIAFLLNLLNTIEKNSLTYMVLNIAGAGLACLASWMVSYVPFYYFGSHLDAGLCFCVDQSFEETCTQITLSKRYTKNSSGLIKALPIYR